MREIKFRAWHEDNKDMVYFDNYKVMRDQYQAHHLVKLIGGHYGDVLMQNTGLKDGSGNEIFEGDVLASASFILGPVEFKDGSFTIADHPDSTQGKDIINQDRCSRLTIIGDIHSNPELLT